MGFIKKIIKVLKDKIKNNGIEFYKTEVVGNKQTFAVKVNGKIIIIDGKVDKINVFDFPFGANELIKFEDDRKWEKGSKLFIERKKNSDFYNYNIESFNWFFSITTLFKALKLVIRQVFP